MAAPTLETNAAADTLRITGGNSGNPVTWNDVWDWDDGGGSSGGNGDVPKDGGGTAKVNTFMTETVVDAVYLILKHIDFGDSVASSYFQSEREQVNFAAAKKIAIRANATLKIGEVYEGYGLDGSSWFVEFPHPTAMLPDGDAGTLLIYSSLFCNKGTSEIQFYSGTLTVKNSIIQQNLYSGGDWQNSIYLMVGLTATFESVYINNMQVMGFRISPSFTDVWFHRCEDGMKTHTTVTVAGLKMTSITTRDIFNSAWSSPVTVIDPEYTISTLQINFDNANSYIYEQYTCNIHIADKDGTNLQNITVACEDQFGTPVFSVNTNINGDIVEQIVTYRSWYGTSETLTTYSPHKFTISKAGYETMVLDNIIVDHPIVWHLELLDELAEGDVRDGVAYGEDSEGNLELPAVGDVEAGVGFGSNGVEFTGDFEVPPEADVRDGEGYGAGGAEFEGDLDLPAIGDVEKGVQFDSLTKTGTFKSPAEADVRDGSQYGKDDTEFTGTLDLPAEADVEDGVTFDGATKEGNFEAPAEADVEDGVGYGAGGVEFEGNVELPAEEDVEVGVGYGSLGTEFEGTYLGLKGNNLTAVLEKSVALTGHLEKKVSLTGELKS